MKTWTLRRQLAAFAVLLVLVLVMASMAPAKQEATNKGVLRRINTMIAANAALTTLGNMINGRMTFNRNQAKDARHDLIVAVKTFPKRFRRPHTDPITRARPTIWTQWDAFTTHAGVAKRAALAIRANTLPALRQTLPRVLVTCIDCHRVYRTPDR